MLVYVTHAHKHTCAPLAVSGRHGPLMQCDCSPLGLLSAPLAELCCMQKPRRGIPQSFGLASCLFTRVFFFFFFFYHLSIFLTTLIHSEAALNRVSRRQRLQGALKRCACRTRPWQIKCDTASQSSIIDGVVKKKKKMRRGPPFVCQRLQRWRMS